MPGGGLVLFGGLPLSAQGEDLANAWRNSVSFCKTDKEIIVFAGSKETREAQNIPYDATCEPRRNRELLRFSQSFVCKKTGKPVIANFEVEGLKDGISGNCSNPTPWRTTPPVTGKDGGEPTFIMRLTAEQAPESCGGMYWDPLLTPVDFDEQKGSVSYTQGPKATPSGGGGGCLRGYYRQRLAVVSSSSEG
jgi:hypothetical protein